MRITIAFDSFYGNNARLAAALAEEGRSLGHEVELVALRESRVRSPTSEILFVGGPTRFGRMTGRVWAFLGRLDRAYWAIHPVVAFDTFGPTGTIPPSEWANTKVLVPGAAGRIQQRAERLGLRVHPRSIRCRVSDMKGPLVPEELEAARRSAREILETLTSPPVSTPQPAVPAVA